jgi:hypothetical protein
MLGGDMEADGCAKVEEIDDELVETDFLGELVDSVG